MCKSETPEIDIPTRKSLKLYEIQSKAIRAYH